MKKIKLFFTFLIFLHFFSPAQDKIQPEGIAYIEKYKDIAMAEMKRAKIPASITLAQGLYESGFGKSFLAINTNNHFGIKCQDTWTGKTFKYTDDAPDECFRVYDFVEQSYIDHSEFLVNRKRYANLFLLDIKDYKAWAYGLKAAGYATNPKYAENLIKYIELYQLYKYDDGTYMSYQPVDELKQKTEQFLSTPIAIEPPKEKKTEYVEINMPNQSNQSNHSHRKETKIENNLSKNTKTVNDSVTKVYQSNENLKAKKIYEHNGLKAVKIYANESLTIVASAIKMNVNELMQLNDIKDENIVLDNQYLYIEKKKSKSKTPTHKVKLSDNMWSISQKYGLQLSSLMKMNHLEDGEEPKVGSILFLKGKAKGKPELRINNKHIENNFNTNIFEQKIVPYVEKEKNTIKDTIYPKITEKHKTSADSNTILSWEDANKLLENKPIQPYKENITNKDENKIVNVETSTEKNISNNKVEQKPSLSENGQHLVIKGDTLYNISKRYGISIANLVEWNSIENGIIKLGTYLKVKP